MKFNLKDNPRQWRKSALLTLLALAFVTGFLRWRGILADKTFFSILALLAVVAVIASIRPRLFRSYHLFSMRIGFAVSQCIGYVALVVFFIFILTPVGLALRFLGKDALQLKHSRKTTTYWQTAKDLSQLDRLF